MLPFYTINRYALLLKPSIALVEWVNAVFPDDPIVYEQEMLHDNTDIYLIPEMNSIEDAEDWLKEHFFGFLENVLEDWCENTDEWPEKMDWAAFEKLVDYTFQTNIVDVVSEEEDDDERDDDYEDDDDDITGFPADKDELDWE